MNAGRVEVPVVGVVVETGGVDVSLTPRGTGLSLTLKRGVLCSVAATLGGEVSVVFTGALLPMRPVMTRLPVAVGSAPPFRITATCCAVGVAMPLAIAVWR